MAGKHSANVSVGNHGTKDKEKTRSKKLLIITITAVVVAVALAVGAYYLFFQNTDEVLDAKRIIKDLSGEKSVTTQKIGKYQQTFAVKETDFKAEKVKKENNTAKVAVNAVLEGEIYKITDYPVSLEYTIEEGEYKLKSITNTGDDWVLSAIKGFSEKLARKNIEKDYKQVELTDHKTDLEKGKDTITFKVSTDVLTGKISCIYKFHNSDGWVLKKTDKSNLTFKKGKTHTVDVDGVKCYTNSAVKNIILLGTDADTGARRSDSMILVSIDSNNKEIKFSSFMRDTYVAIDGYGNDKLNAAFAYGGADLAVKTIEKNYGIKIDNYITTGFSNFKHIVDALGGVDIELDEDECGYINWQLGKNGQTATYGQVQVKNGVQKLNGQQALWFCRDRGSEVYSGDDFTRTSRQRRMLIGLVKAYKNSTVADVVKLTEALIKYVDTDLTKSDLAYLAKYSPQFFAYETSERCNPDRSSGWSAGTSSVGAWIISISDWKDTRKQIAEYIYPDLKK